MEAFFITAIVFFTLWIIVIAVVVSRNDAPALRGHGYSRRRSFGSTLAAATIHELAHASCHPHWHDDHVVANDVHGTADVDLAGAGDIEVDECDVIESSELSCDMDLEETTTFEYGDSSWDVDLCDPDD
jgi:hypothetical protein